LYYELFGLAAVLATFQKNGRFFSNHLVTLSYTMGGVQL
jgi:hypothetical protein